MTHKLTRLTSLLLAVIMTFSMLLVPSEAASFTDVSSKAWYKAAVDYVYEHGWMAGTSETTFAPNEEVTRGMAVTVLARFAGAETNNAAPAFTDTPTGKWYSGAAAWAAEQGIVAGTGDGCFAPNRSINRQDLATILYQFIKKQGYDIPADADFCFADRATISGYALQATDFCAASGLMSGFEDSSFRPKATATRAQIAQILMRLDTLIKGQEVPYEPMPAQSFDGEAGEDMSVSVNAPEGTLPENTDMTVSRVNNSLIRGTLEAASDMGTMVAAVDISFAKEGEEIEPEAEVEVALTLAGLENLKNPQVYHLRDDGTVEHVETYSGTRGPQGNTLTFKAKDFSIYAILDQPVVGDERLTVHFKYTTYTGEGENQTAEDHEIAVVYVKTSDKQTSTDADTGEVRDPLVEIMYDPGTGAYVFQEDELFAGWVPDVQNYVSDTPYCKTIEEVREYIRNMTWNNGDEITFYARIMKVFTITYMENEVVSLGSDNVMRTRNETAKFYIVEREYVPETNDRSFEGWKATEDTYQNIIDATDPDAIYSKNQQIQVKGDVHLVVYCPKGFWISFNEKPDPTAHKGAKYVAPIFCSGGVLPSQATVDSELDGYTFDGWYDPDVGWNDGAGKITNTSQITDPSHFQDGKLKENVNLTAHWTMNPTTSYTVVVWMQSVKDSATETDNSKKTYDYYTYSVVNNATSGAAIPVPNNTTYGTGISRTGFHYSWNDAGDRTLKPDGSTVLNIYYDRNVITYTFYIPNGYQSTSSKPSSSEQANFYYRTGNYYNYVYHEVFYFNSTYSYYEYTGTPSTSGTYYAIYNNRMYELNYHTYWGVWYFTDNDNNTHWSDEEDIPFYIFLTTANNSYYEPVYQVREVYTGLYEQKLVAAGYTWPTDYRWFSAKHNKTFTSIQEMFQGSSSNVNYYGRIEAFDTNVYHILQDVDGSWPTTAAYTIPTAVGNLMLFRSFQGFDEEEYRIALPAGTTYRLISAIDSNGNYTYDGSNKTVGSDGWTEWIPANRSVTYSGDEPDDMEHHAATAGGIEFRYSRNTYDLIFMIDGVQVAKHEAIPYEGSLKNEDTENNPAVPSGAVFVDWYKDASLTVPFDFANETMPLNGITVYGSYQVPEYRIFLYPNINPDDPRDGCWDWNHKEGGESVEWNDKYQSVCFKIEAGLISGGQMFQPDRGDGIDLVGWYTDPEFQHPWTFSTEVNDSTTTEYDKTDPALKTEFVMTTIHGTDDQDHDSPIRDGSGNIQWDYNKDLTNNRTWITRKLQLYARWRYKIDGALGINVEYATTNGTEYVTGVVTDSKLYQDAADAIAYPCDNKLPAGHEQDGTRFMYWIVQTYNEDTGEYEDKLNEKGEKVIVYPGGTFSVELADALKEANPNSTGETDRYTYTVRLKAFYKNPKQEKATHVIWVGNGGTCQINGETREFLYSQDTQINAPIPIELDFFTNPGHVFLGWARLTEESCGVTYDAQGNLTHFDVRDDLTDANLWLEFYPADDTHSTGYFKIKNDAANVNGREATHIAADEDAPYHIMYAVWSQDTYFYVFHSSDSVLEAVPITETRENATIDLTSMVRPGYLYGGYYSNYGGFSTENLLQAEYNAPYQSSLSFTVPNAVNYTGANTKCTVTDHGASVTRRFWTRGEAGTVSGDSVVPHTGDVFCLKEVPNTYLANKLAWVYDKNTNEMLDVFLLTVVDDNLYGQIGFKVKSGEDPDIEYDNNLTLQNRDALAATIKLIQGDIGEYTITATDFADIEGGYVAMKQLYKLGSDAEVAAGTNTILPGWVTLDGIQVMNVPATFTISEDLTAINMSLFGPFTGTEKLYVNVGDATMGGYDWVLYDEQYGYSKTRIKFIDNSGNEYWSLDWATYLNDNTIAETTIPAGNWTKFVVYRFGPQHQFNPSNPAAGNWGASAQIDLRRSENLLVQFPNEGSSTPEVVWGIYNP